MGAWFSLVPREIGLRRGLWPKFNITNLMATSSLVLMFVPKEEGLVTLNAVLTMVDVSEGTTA